MSSPFQLLAEQQMPRQVKLKAARLSQSESEAPLVPTAMEKAQREASQQLREYEKWRRAKRESVLSKCEGLEDVLARLNLDGAQAFIDFFVQRDWSALSRDERHDVLSAAGDAISRMRIRQGYPPIDDSLPGEHPTAFEIIRKVLTGVGHHEGAKNADQ